MGLGVDPVVKLAARAGDTVTVRDADGGDLDEVIAIERVSFGPPWSRQQFADEIGAPFSHFLVAIDADGKVIGYLVWRQVLEELQIFNIAVDPAARRGGIGRELLRRAFDTSQSTGATAATLEVHCKNESALEFYRALGFQEAGRRRNYYGPNGDDAVLMELALTRQRQ